MWLHYFPIHNRQGSIQEDPTLWLVSRHMPEDVPNFTFSAKDSKVGGRKHSFGAQDGALPTQEDQIFCRSNDIVICSPVIL